MSNTQDITQSRSFCDFYRDETLFGHSLLVPSIYVVDSYQRIFSEVKQEGCDALIEVISRIVLFVILPVIAVICLVLTPIGLICKACASLCCAPPEFIRKPQESPRKDSPRSSKEAIDEALTQTDSILKTIRLADIDKLKLKEAKEILDAVTPQIQKDSECFNRSPRYYFLKDKIENYEFELSRPGYISFKDSFKDKIEVPTKEDGDCLPASLRLLSEFNKSTSSYVDNNSMRHELVQWILNHYEKDEQLQRHLASSLAEHLMVKNEKLKEEHDNWIAIKMDLKDKIQLLNSTETRTENEEQYECARQRIEQIPKEMEDNEVLIAKILLVTGGAHDNAFNFASISEYMPSYIDELRREGVYGGLPEAYAYSMIHKACVRVFRKYKDANGIWQIDEQPFAIINAGFITEKRPARELTFQSNHYNALFPKSDFGNG